MMKKIQAISDSIENFFDALWELMIVGVCNIIAIALSLFLIVALVAGALAIWRWL